MPIRKLPSGLTPLTVIALLVVLAALALALPRWWAGWRYAPHIADVDQAPPASAAIVFGAGLRRDGGPTTVLADRVRTAVALFQAGKVPLMVMSGTVRDGYDEPAAMRDLAIALGVPDDAIVLDPTGDRTFATCLMAHGRFASASVILVSQAYHLPRALATCAGLGLEASGVAADQRVYRTSARQFWLLREYPATLVALIDTYLLPHPEIPAGHQTVDRQPPHES